MIVKHYGLILVGMLCIILFNGCGNSDDFAEMMKKGEKSAVNGRWDEALDYGKRALVCQPNSAEALLLTALAYENNGLYHEALEEVKKASAIAPENFFVQYTLGKMYFDRGRYDSSVAPLKTALKLRPYDMNTVILLADVSVKLKNSQDALHYYSILAKHGSYRENPKVWSELGRIMLEQNKLKASYSYFSWAYSLQKKNPNADIVLNMAVLCDKYPMVKSKAQLYKAYAKRYYQEYLRMTQGNSSLARERAAVEARIKAI